MRNRAGVGLAMLLCALTPSGWAGTDGDGVERAPFALTLSAPINTWDEGIPLGNGLMGGLLWGSDGTVNVSLDRGDLWDERLPEIFAQKNWNYATIKRLVAEKDQSEMVRLFDAPYGEVAYPTKLPGGRLVLVLDAPRKAESFSLDMKQAVGRVALSDGLIETFFSAVEPVAMIRVKGAKLQYHYQRPSGLDTLGYGPATSGGEGDTTWTVQEAALGLTYAIVVASRTTDDETQLAVAITTSNDGADSLRIGRERVTQALQTGYDGMLKDHLKWWSGFWAVSDVHVPDPAIQHHYNLVKYLYGAGSRSGAPPMPLQGVWTRDDGGLPPWKGDYHNDLNTQMTYLAYHTAGLFDSGESFLDYNWDLLPQYRAFARSFYGVDGAVVPGVATLAGKPTGGWAQYSLSPTNGLWVGQSFYLHWRYTMDRRFLETRAYPWLSEIATAVVGLLEERNGRLYLPLSSSPEIHDNSMRAWLTPNSNYDLALMQWAFDALAEMADELDKADEAKRWRGLRAKLDALDVDDSRSLTFAKGEPYDASHRHFSHALAIHPLGVLTVDAGAGERQIVEATVQRIHDKGTWGWVGYSFSWFSCMLARAGKAEPALDTLIDYERAFILRNGFHANGDQIGAGLSGFTYRPFTLEGNFLAMQAVHEMLLQSWGGVVRVFPATSTRWADVSFSDLRAEGGFKVSAARENGRTVSVRVEATTGQTLRLRDPFGGRPVRWSLDGVRLDGGDYVIELQKGQVLEGAPETP